MMQKVLFILFITEIPVYFWKYFFFFFFFQNFQEGKCHKEMIKMNLEGYSIRADDYFGYDGLVFLSL